MSVSLRVMTWHFVHEGADPFQRFSAIACRDVIRMAFWNPWDRFDNPGKDGENREWKSVPPASPPNTKTRP